MKSLILTTLGLSSALLFSSCAQQATSDPSLDNTTSVKPYPFKTCIVTDQKWGFFGAKYTKIYNGQEVKFCCTPCVHIFESNKEPYLKKIKEAQKANAE